MDQPKRSELAKVYGPIKDFHWEKSGEFMTYVRVPEPLQKTFKYDGNSIKRVYCNKDMGGALAKAFANIVERELRDEVKEYNGCWNVRSARGSSRLSVHSYGLAIDINASTNRLGKPPTISKKLVKCFTDVGFVWGGNWKRPDGMHFQWCIEE